MRTFICPILFLLIGCSSLVPSSQYPSLSDDALCIQWCLTKSPEAQQEIDHRRLFSELDWKLVESAEFELGMNRLILFCLYGKPQLTSQSLDPEGNIVELLLFYHAGKSDSFVIKSGKVISRTKGY